MPTAYYYFSADYESLNNQGSKEEALNSVAFLD